ncbi:MAG: GlsB/YeaQ/YmgE family stress response membrane protein [Actinobacteria bacterium]|nr:GlsB/YeaQ/YmgE family stress response membrane protein [Actinomycetota bacterium]
MLGAIIGILLSGLIVGALARFALPGRDALSIWRTILLGILGSIVGGFAAALTGVIDPTPPEGEEMTGGELVTGFLFALAGAVVLLILYRRFVEKRPITGPDAR